MEVVFIIAVYPIILAIIIFCGGSLLIRALDIGKKKNKCSFCGNDGEYDSRIMKVICEKCRKKL